MGSLLLYSCNPWLKWYIANHFGGDTHYVWCSEVFDPRRKSPDDPGSLIPPTSSPFSIAQDLAAAIHNRDRHNAKIKSQKASLASLAEGWRRSGAISVKQADEILYMLSSDEMSLWRPVLYIIPTSVVGSERILEVPPEERAGFGPEYKIADLKGSEFERIEFHGL